MDRFYVAAFLSAALMTPIQPINSSTTRVEDEAVAAEVVSVADTHWSGILGLCIVEAV